MFSLYWTVKSRHGTNMYSVNRPMKLLSIGLIYTKRYQAFVTIELLPRFQVSIVLELIAYLIPFNLLRPNGAVWWPETGPTLVQAMARCSTSPSYYLKQYWLLISEITLQSSKCIFASDISAFNTRLVVNITSNVFADHLLLNIFSRGGFTIVLVLKCIGE